MIEGKHITSLKKDKSYLQEVSLIAFEDKTIELKWRSDTPEIKFKAVKSINVRI